MKTKNIFKTVALAMLMPTMLLTTACSSDDDLVNNTANTETVANKGYALPVTVNVTRGDGATRASFDGSKLNFSAGDKLFVMGDHDKAGQFAGTLDYDAVSGKFSGTVTTKEEYTGTADALFTDANSARAFLMPAGYGSYGFFSIEGSGYDAMISFDFTKAFALTKAAALEQFSVERAFSYSSGFALTPMNAIANFTISGLTANKEVAVSFDTGMTGVIDGNVTTSAEGVATFVVGVFPGQDLKDCTLTVDGNNIAMPTKTTEAGKVYNIARSAAPGSNTIDLSTVTVATTAQNGDVLTGTLGTNVQISIADGATVILNNVSINADGTWKSSNYAGITCEGDATIILSGTNTVRGFGGYYPGLQAGPAGKTLTIMGTGSLTALYANVNYPGGSGIGAARLVACGNIVIEGGNITATGGYAGIGGAYGYSGGEEGTCGDITITGGTVTATALSYGAGIGAGRGEYGSCGNITISGGTVTAIATAKNTVAAAIGAGSESSTCTSVTIGTGITSLTMTNGHKSATGIVSNFINATAVNANTTPITTMLSTSVTDPTITMGMGMAGFATSYNEGTKTWTVTKK